MALLLTTCSPNPTFRLVLLELEIVVTVEAWFVAVVAAGGGTVAAEEEDEDDGGCSGAAALGSARPKPSSSSNSSSTVQRPLRRLQLLRMRGIRTSIFYLKAKI
jgi:hypothetical protein